MYCKTCGDPNWSPKKRIVDGVIVEQCVDQIHDDFSSIMSRDEAEFLRGAKTAFREAGTSRPYSRPMK